MLIRHYLFMVCILMGLQGCSAINQFSTTGTFPNENTTGLLVIGVETIGWTDEPHLKFIKYNPQSMTSVYPLQIVKASARSKKWGHDYFIIEMNEGRWALKSLEKLVIGAGIYKTRHSAGFTDKYIFDVKANQVTYFGEFSIDNNKEKFSMGGAQFQRESSNLDSFIKHLKKFRKVTAPIVQTEPLVLESKYTRRKNASKKKNPAVEKPLFDFKYKY